ncbi:MAG: hypothetical protein U0234_25060 [Sandaracinus sp.]
MSMDDDIPGRTMSVALAEELGHEAVDQLATDLGRVAGQHLLGAAAGVADAGTAGATRVLAAVAQAALGPTADERVEAAARAADRDAALRVPSLAAEVRALTQGLGALRALVERLASPAAVSSDALAERAAWLAKVADAARALEARVEDLGARVARLLADGEMQRVWRNIAFEAQREAIDERRRMLAYAIVGTVSSADRLSVAQVARVERTMRELDPHDLHVLADVSRIPMPTWRTTAQNSTDEERSRVHNEAKAAHRRRMAALRSTAGSADVLQAAGCIRVFNPAILDSYECIIVTDIGDWVLAVADPYLRASAPPDP